jgi:hypothetical protein
MLKLAIGIPAYGSALDVGHAGMWCGFGIALQACSDRFTLGSFATYHINGIDHCRNLMVYDALQADCDWLLMVDADTYHFGGVEAIGDNGVDMLQMVMDGHRRDAALIGAPVRARKVESDAFVVYLKRNDRFVLADEEYFAGKIAAADRIGGAFTAINLNWLRAYWPVSPWFKMTHSEGKERPHTVTSEDYFFCDGARGRGGLVLCDGRFTPSHVARRRLVGDER